MCVCITTDGHALGHFGAHVAICAPQGPCALGRARSAAVCVYALVRVLVYSAMRV
jgi:hypothetical protein